jgi:putative Holliday junction resolvase
MIEHAEGRILGIDPGERRIGVAVSDISGSIATPFQVVKHESRETDANNILEIARSKEAGLIIIGAAYGLDGEETPASRKATRLAEVIMEKSKIKVILWDESGSTKKAREIRLLAGSGRKQRRGHQDEIAAAFILQDFLDNAYLLHTKMENGS